jgi:hypothetical protein
MYILPQLFRKSLALSGTTITIVDSAGKRHSDIIN